MTFRTLSMLPLAAMLVSHCLPLAGMLATTAQAQNKPERVALWPGEVPKSEAAITLHRPTQPNGAAIAAKIMAEQKVVINDMQTYVLEQGEDKKFADPFSIHRVVPLHPPVVRSILSALDMPDLPNITIQ